MPYLLLTGATGLLGRYLLRDLTLADKPLAVVARSSKHEAAAQRIETAMAHWEGVLGRSLVRPVVLEGNIAEPGLGLSGPNIDWLAANCDSVLHSAASLTFSADEKTGEPFRSNVQGTRNVIALCARAGIRQCHHVSTAYVCGRRRGRVLESELDVGQQPSNEYEQTKIIAEKEMLAATAFDRVTVYRPSIIVGDSDTGYTTSFHGFYTPLRLVHSLVSTLGWRPVMEGQFMENLGLAGDERKNLTPVNWVSAAMTALIGRAECHGRTYNLTNPAAVTAATIQDVILAAMTEVDWSKPTLAKGAAIADLGAAFREQMGVYQSYWNDDPEFDSSHTQAALPQTPCPALDRETLLRLARFALKTNFGWPREATVVPKFDVASKIDKWLAAAPPARGQDGGVRFVSLQVSGEGGGQWHLAVDRGKLVAAGLGVRNGSALTCYLNSATFARLARGEMRFEDSINSGRLVVAGNSMHTSELACLLGKLMSNEKSTINVG